MKILTWNINGIRASKQSLKTLFDTLDADVICLQETKVTRDMLDEPSAIVDGYSSYFSFSRKRSGYSGVATFCKETVTPVKAEEGLSSCLGNQADDKVGCYGYLEDFDTEVKELESLDAEGRAVITQHQIRNKDGETENLSIINVYVPRAGEREDRQQYKLRFLSLLQNRAETLVQNNHHVIVLGDINTTHTGLDNCDTESEDFTVRPSRLWMNQFLRDKDRDSKLECMDEDETQLLGETMTPHLIGGLFVDSFRELNPSLEGAFTCWCTTTNARENNYGRRLDYVLTSSKFHDDCAQEGIVMQQVEGSDHCPVKVEFNCKSVASRKCPSLCTKYMPEFKGNQQKLSLFFTKKSKSEVISQNTEITKMASNETEKKRVMEANRSPTKILNLKKRPSETLESQKLKRLKSDTGKQSSLSSFFNKPQQDKPSQQTKHLNLTISETSPKKTSETKLVGDKASTSPYFNKHAVETKGIKTNLDDKPKSSASAWKNLLSGPGKAPLCKGHKEPCVLRTVKKDGPNKNKQFYVCARGEGHSSNPEARCDHFVWVNHKKINKMFLDNI